MLPPPTDNRASAAEGGGRAIADRKSVGEGGRTGMEYQARVVGFMTQTMLLPPPTEPVPVSSPLGRKEREEREGWEEEDGVRSCHVQVPVEG